MSALTAGRRRPRRTAWVVWGAAVAVYLLAVFHRSSLAVAGLVAVERFDISAAQLAAFTMLQLLVYAGMQIPVGVMLDQVGSRVMLACGLTLMTVGQLAFALLDSYGPALAARALIGVGDAMVFVSVLRLIAYWFPPLRIPLVNQLTGLTGQVGAIAAAVPMSAALGQFGWTQAYAASAAVGVLLGVVLLVVVRDAPPGVDAATGPVRLDAVRHGLRASWAEPGTRLGLWTHFTTQFSFTVFTLLGGYPYLRTAHELGSTQAGLLLSVGTLAAVVSGPLLGTFAGRYPFHRSTLVLSIIASIVLTWTVVLVWPGPAPLALLLVLMVVMGVGGPASMVGFDFVRTSNPSHRLGGASGIVNQGGFVASLCVIVTIGVVLDVLTPAGADGYTRTAFTAAMCTQYVAWALGITQIVRFRRRTRRALADADPEGYAAMRRIALRRSTAH